MKKVKNDGLNSLVFVGSNEMQALNYLEIIRFGELPAEAKHKDRFWRLPTFQANMRYFCKIQAPAGVLQYLDG